MRPSLCTVWAADITELEPRHRGLLDNAECLRAARFRVEADEQRFVLGSVLLRLIAARRIGCDPTDVVVDRRCRRCGAPHGKPSVGHELEASISHSGNIVVATITSIGPIGVDVELVRETDYSDILARVCGPTEQAHVRKPRDLLTYWTRKEAVLKATGEGLSCPLSTVYVAPPERPAGLIRHGVLTGADCAMGDLDVGSSHTGAVAVLTGNPVRFSLRAAGPLLSA